MLLSQPRHCWTALFHHTSVKCTVWELVHRICRFIYRWLCSRSSVFHNFPDLVSFTTMIEALLPKSRQCDQSVWDFFGYWCILQTKPMCSKPETKPALSCSLGWNKVAASWLKAYLLSAIHFQQHLREEWVKMTEWCEAVVVLETIIGEGDYRSIHQTVCVLFSFIFILWTSKILI